MNTPTFLLWFAGRIDSPDTGGCAAVCKREGAHEDDEPLWSVSRRMGSIDPKLNAADYFGLIAGLRRLLQEIPVHEFNVTIMGSSEQTLCELIGEKKVTSPMIQHFYSVAMGLVNKIKGEVTWELVTQTENGEADYLAEKASKKELLDGDSFVLEPSTMNFISAEIEGKRVLAGHDAGASEASNAKQILVDAGTVVDTLGISALEDMLDPGMTTVLQGKVEMTVLGILPSLSFTMYMDGGEKEEVAIDDAVVVDFLPWPIQISLEHPSVDEVVKQGTGWSISSSSGQEMSASVVPVRFQGHAYWKVDASTSAAVPTGHSLD
jgi:hypothetical protein